ncbi:hypothetical protein FisN_1Lu624 [Fistulifera solaris]|uniref:Oxidation resistance protein 1 n=1 Tax=Fistulifera solaris TaxID=1519565 RepID=A0A1Z5K0T9_FISSO|nr:hypothetical protein FisN_1Lu624 [Fistulifera solaris]|eukprot:GAX19914.1 hypothetical protein FisN_1Lu624 [Fistulifera solaris]
MACWCCIDTSENDADNQQRANHQAPTAPLQINISRGEPIPVFEEDIQAVKAWRDSRKASPRKEKKEQCTKQRQEPDPPLQRTLQLRVFDKTKIATLDSIEVDDLSTVSRALKSGEGNRKAHSLDSKAPLSIHAPQLSTIPTVRVPRTDPPRRIQQSAEQSLGTIEGIVSNSRDRVAMDRHFSPASPTNGNSRIWSPTTVISSLSSDDNDSQRLLVTTIKDESTRSEPTPYRDHFKRSEQPCHNVSTGVREEVRDQGQRSQITTLSYLPSDVATDVREQYLLACRLLKTTIVQKETTLNAVESDFLLDLVRENFTDPSPSQIDAVNQASKVLTSDALFRVSSSLLNSPDESSCEASESENKTVRRKNIVAPYALDGTKKYPFRILGMSERKPQVLTPAVMEALRGFLPMHIAEENFWMKFSFYGDDGSLMSLLATIRTSMHTILVVETTAGFVFGVFCSTPWRIRRSWFGSDESFVWRLKHSRRRRNSETRSHLNDNEMEVYPHTGHDVLVQYATNKTLAIGGGVWNETETNPFPQEPTGIGFTIDGDLLGGETNSCATFANPRLCGSLTNNTEFEIQYLEVWTLTPCSTIEEAEILETQKFFIGS